MNVRKPAKKAIYLLNKNPLSRFLYQHEISKRSKLSLSDIVPLSQKINMFAPFTSEIHNPNDWYGHANNLKVFLGLSPNYKFKFNIEHGLYLNEQVDDIDIETNLPSIITYSNYRKKILEKYRKHVFSIGPFIHYAKNFLTDRQISDEKKRLGKSILLFPAHSSSMIGIEYDIVNLCRKVKKIGKDFDSIRVCLYWKDVLLGKNKIYQDFGFECLTAGHILDPLFLPRLKSIIQISDLTISNIASSQVGFCIYLNKPHILFAEKLKLETSRKWKNRINKIFQSKGYREIINEFSKQNYTITKRQKELIRKYWGTDNIKTKKELGKIILKTEEIYRA